MLWSGLFFTSIIQCIFLISLLLIRGSKNIYASRILITLLVLMALTNFGYLVVRTELAGYIPQFFAIPFGMMFLFGPLFYFYSKSIIDQDFEWRTGYWLHFIPYVIQLAINFPVFLLPRSNWDWLFNSFLSGQLEIRTIDKLLFGVQDLHLFIYLFYTFRRIRSAKRNQGNHQYVIPVLARVNWLSALAACLSVFLATVVCLYVLILVKGKYNPVTNYTYTIVTSIIIYFIAYKLVLDPALVSPDFAQKYRTYMPFTRENGEMYLSKITYLMNEKKIYLNPDLKLATMAEKLELPPHQLSKFINEKFNKSFTDYINGYRVNEFINRINHPDHKALTVYGIALEVGFNSKSAFNSAFKKITGKTPSEYKTE